VFGVDVLQPCWALTGKGQREKDQESFQIRLLRTNPGLYTRLSQEAEPGLARHDAPDEDALAAEATRARGKKRPLTVAQAKALKDEHVGSVRPLQALAAEARQLERRVADLVNAAYGLTAEEVALMWRTAPPRMPGEPPGV
jgi:hypothetical protein